MSWVMSFGEVIMLATAGLIGLGAALAVILGISIGGRL